MLVDEILVRDWTEDAADEGIGQTSYERKLSQGYTKEDMLLFKRAFRQPVNAYYDYMRDVPCRCTDEQVCDRCRLMQLRKVFGPSEEELKSR